MPYKKSCLIALLALSSTHLLADKAPQQAKKCSAGEPFQPGCHQYPESYTAPAAIDLHQSWIGFADASFLYWGIEEDGLTLAQSAILSQGTLALSPDTKFVGYSFDYHPGFKVQIGAVYNHEWNINAVYTRLTGSSSVSKEAPENESDISGLGVWNLNDWFQQTITFSHINSAQSQSLSAKKIHSTWKLKLNMLDLNVERASYLGSRLIISPLMGMRAAWIDQHVNVSIFQAEASVGGGVYLGPQPISSRNHSRTFGVGPRLGAQARYLLPMGWRIDSHGSGSLLATYSSSLEHKEDAQSIAIPPGPYKIRNPHYHGILPNAEVGLGCGWGKYLSQQRYYLDLSASYDFTLFWAQNVLREMLDEAWNGTSGSAGNLAFHGLTVNACLNF